MSVYSGFATRKQEGMYNMLVAKLIKGLSYKILSSIPYQEISKYFQENKSDNGN